MGQRELFRGQLGSIGRRVMAKASRADVSPIRAGITCRCPRCGRGKLFSGFLDVTKRCAECKLDFSKQDGGDGPAVFVIMILGFVIVGLALVVEMNFAPPVWLHLVLWIPLTFIGSLALLRPFKATLIALQYRHKVAFESGSRGRG